MQIFDINIIELLSNPLSALGGAAATLLVYQGWKIFNSVFKPVSYVEKLYDLTDDIVEGVDNNIIDKIRNKKVRESANNELREILIKRKEKIQYLIERLAD